MTLMTISILRVYPHLNDRDDKNINLGIVWENTAPSTD